MEANNKYKMRKLAIIKPKNVNVSDRTSLSSKLNKDVVPSCQALRRNKVDASLYLAIVAIYVPDFSESV